MTTFEHIREAASAIRKRFGVAENEALGRVGVILGSGLGPFADAVSKNIKDHSMPYHEIPNFPVSSVEGHQSRFVKGLIDGHNVMVMQGRVHRYEGYSAAQVAFPARVLSALGARVIVLTNASGGINTEFRAGDLMLIRDQINFTGDNPMLGPNDLRIGPRFFDMTDAFSPTLCKLAHQVASKLGIGLREGVYIGVLGPNYETPAEIRAFRTMGADAVGMSTVFEALAARHGGADLLGIACITNAAAGLSAHKLTHDEVTAIANQSSDRLSSLLLTLISSLAAQYD